MNLKQKAATYALGLTLLSAFFGCATLPEQKPEQRPIERREEEPREELTLGNENLFHHRFYPLIEDKDIGIMANHTTRETIDQLIDDPNVTVRAIYAPEHGLLNAIGAGEEVKDTTYRDIPVYGIYGTGSQRRISQDLLEGLDALLFEIQDIGTRHYTYISSMYLAMDAWADYTQTLPESGTYPFIVLDRPPTTNANSVEGPVLEPEWQTFIGVGSIPNRYGMTIGELAQMFKDEPEVMDGVRYRRTDDDDSYSNVSSIDLVVVPMTGYDRRRSYDELFDEDLFIPTSPNIPTVDSAIHYAGTGLFDGHVIQEIVPGYQRKGYTQFEHIRIPFLETEEDMREFLQYAGQHYDFPGISIRPLTDPETNETNIIHLDIEDQQRYNPTYTALALMYTAAEHYPEQPAFSSEQRRRVFNKGMGNEWIAEMLENPQRESFSEVLEELRYQAHDFNQIREHYLLY